MTEEAIEEFFEDLDNDENETKPTTNIHTKTDLFWLYLSYSGSASTKFVAQAEQLLDDGLSIVVKDREQLVRISKIEVRNYVGSITYHSNVFTKSYMYFGNADVFDHFVSNNLLNGSVDKIKSYIMYFIGHAMSNENTGELEKYLDYFDEKFDIPGSNEKVKREYLDYVLKVMMKLTYSTDHDCIPIIETLIGYFFTRYDDISYDYFDEVETIQPNIRGQNRMLELFVQSKNLAMDEVGKIYYNRYFNLFVFLIGKCDFQVNVSYYFEKIMHLETEAPTFKYRTSGNLFAHLVDLEKFGHLQHLIDVGLDVTHGSVIEILLQLDPPDYCKFTKKNMGNPDLNYMKKIISICKPHADFWEENCAKISTIVCNYILGSALKISDSMIQEFVDLGIDFAPTLERELHKPITAVSSTDLTSAIKLWILYTKKLTSIPNGNPTHVFCVCLLSGRRDLALEMVESGMTIDPFTGPSKVAPHGFFTREIFKDFLVSLFAPEIFTYAHLFGFDKERLTLSFDLKSKKNLAQDLNNWLFKTNGKRNNKLLLPKFFTDRLTMCINADKNMIGRHTLRAIITNIDFDSKYLDLLSPSITKYISYDFGHIGIDYQQLLEYMMEVKHFMLEPVVLVIEHLRKNGARLELLYDQFRKMLIENCSMVVSANDVYYPIVQDWLDLANLRIDELIEKLYTLPINELMIFNKMMGFTLNNYSKMLPTEKRRSQLLVDSITTKTIVTMIFKLEYYSTDPESGAVYKDILIDFIESGYFNLNLHYKYVFNNIKALSTLTINDIYDVYQSLSDQKIDIRWFFDKMFSYKRPYEICSTVIEYLIEKYVHTLI
jgi:hypothetical protein